MLREAGSPPPSNFFQYFRPDSENEDLEDLGGSSAFAAMEPTSLRKFKSYDLRKPPFSLPEPLDSWPEVHQNALMLAYEGKVLQKFQ